MKTKKTHPIMLLLRWAGKDKYYLFLSASLSFVSGLCAMIPYAGIYRLMDAVFAGVCTRETVARNALMIAFGTVARFVLFGVSGAVSHKGAYGALFRVRCMVVDHMARIPLG
ncbi:MAG: ABC transporter ATP-binding protein, partial [Oscillospiraceae bacterium]|nr:ABC transporter ATP-binding protein [Oscillospiraceae bacterium]